MKNFILLIVFTFISTSSFATNEIEDKELESPKVQNAQTDEAKIEDNTEFFGNLSKSNSSSKNSLGIGKDKQDSHNSDTEICNVAANTDVGKSGTGLCGVPADKSQEEFKNDSKDEPS